MNATENIFFRNSCGACTRPLGKVKLLLALNQNVLPSSELRICHSGDGWWLFFFFHPLCFSAEVPPRGYRYHCQAASEYQWRRRVVCNGLQTWTLLIWSVSNCFVTLPWKILLWTSSHILKRKGWQKSLLESPCLFLVLSNGRALHCCLSLAKQCL